MCPTQPFSQWKGAGRVFWLLAGGLNLGYYKQVIFLLFFFYFGTGHSQLFSAAKFLSDSQLDRSVHNIKVIWREGVKSS